MINNTALITNACLNAMDCFAWCICYLVCLLASTFKRTHLTLSLAIHLARSTGLPKDPTSTSEKPERSRARRETQSDPYGLELLQVRAALDSVYSTAPISVKYPI